MKQGLERVFGGQDRSFLVADVALMYIEPVPNTIEHYCPHHSNINGTVTLAQLLRLLPAPVRDHGGQHIRATWLNLAWHYNPETELNLDPYSPSGDEPHLT